MHPSSPHSAAPSQPKIHILLATYQGERYLQDQLDSIEGQSYGHWRLTISDDGSQDETLAMCQRFAEKHPTRVRLLKGPQTGSTANFFHLMTAVDAVDSKDWFAFSDQDDIWLPGKLARAVEALQQQEFASERPILYCGRTQLVDESLRPLGLSPLPRRPLGFGNALVQNVVNGNTAVFNLALLNLMRRVHPDHAVVHDWTAYLAATACDGLVQFDPNPQLLYRQHDKNVIGSQTRWIDKWGRLRMLFKGRYRHWGTQTEQIVADLAPFLSESAKSTLAQFNEMRHAQSVWRRLQASFGKGIWRQTLAGRISLWIALACKQI